MKIESLMSLTDLSERIGSTGNVPAWRVARVMRQLLVQRFDGMVTEDIPEDYWLAMVLEATDYAASEPVGPGDFDYWMPEARPEWRT